MITYFETFVLAGIVRELALVRTLDEKLQENSGHILYGKKLQALALQLMATKDMFSAAKSYVTSYLGSREKDVGDFVHTGAALPVEGCRYIFMFPPKVGWEEML